MPGDNEKPKKSKSKLILILLIVVVVLAAGSGAGWFFFIRESPDAKMPVKSPAYVDEEDGDDDDSGNTSNNKYVYPPDTKFEQIEYNDIIVNLAGGGGNSYLRVSMTFKYPASVKKMPEEIAEKDPQIKDSILTCLRSQSRADTEKTEDLKKSLLKAVNKNMTYGDFVEVYFTDFLVQ